MRRASGTLSRIAFLGVSLVPLSESATPSARLIYTRSTDVASCPNEADLRAAVSARFGYDPFFAWARQTVIVQVWRTGSRFSSRVQMVDEQGFAHGTRVLTSDRDSCSDLFRATALAISIAMDASLADPRPTVSTAAPSEAHDPTSVPPQPPIEAVASPEPPPVTDHAAGPTPDAAHSRFFAGVDLLGLYGTAPSLTAGFSAFAGLRGTALSLGLELEADAPASKGESGESVTATMVAAHIVPCAHDGIVYVCAVGSVGWLQGSASGVAERSPQGTPVAAAGGRVAFEWPQSRRWSLRVHGDLLADLTRTSLLIDGQSVWTAARFEVSVGAGAIAYFP